ncbi:hypothetical protein D3C78_1143520 [compost metagenome]
MGAAVRRRQAAGRHRHPGPRQLRRLDWRPLRRLPLAPVRREHSVQPVLHQRHHGQSQGRAVQPPLDHAARLRGGLARRHGPVGARCGAAGGAHVPRQCLGRALLGGADRRQGGVPRPGARRQVAVRADGSRRRDLRGRRAHDLADAAGLYAAQRAAVQHPQAHGDRRLGLPAGHDHHLPGCLRRRSAARLGHDRDEPAGHVVHAQEQAP